MLVEGAGEVGINDLAVVQRFADDAANKLEEVQVVGAASLVILHYTVGVGLEGGVAHGDEQGDVGVECLPSHHLCNTWPSELPYSTHNASPSVRRPSSMSVTTVLCKLLVLWQRQGLFR